MTLTPKLYQAKNFPSVKVEGVQWDGTVEQATDIIDWVLKNGGGAKYVCSALDEHDQCHPDIPHHIAIRSSNVDIRYANPGDWILTNYEREFVNDTPMAREFWPHESVSFPFTYSPAEESPEVPKETQTASALTKVVQVMNRAGVKPLYAERIINDLRKAGIIFKET